MRLARKRNKTWKVLIALLVLVLIAGVIYLNWGFLKDYMIGMMYRPSAEALELRASLNLTDRGTLIFNASQPTLNDKDAFNHNCRTIESNTAILGCYTEEKIYVYDIKNDELEGIREATMAHELLHAVYARMNENERGKWKTSLTSIYEKNDELQEELDIYPEAQRMEELYVRVGTEIKELPEPLEEHYASIFKDQDLIVRYYEKYIKVFTKIEEKLSDLSYKIEKKTTEINTKSKEYEEYLEDLNSRIAEFNTCAMTTGCFDSEDTFQAKRGVLVNEQEILNGMYEDINNAIAEYNYLIIEYNKNVLHGQRLDKIMNSNPLPNALE